MKPRQWCDKNVKYRYFVSFRNHLSKISSLILCNEIDRFEVDLYCTTIAVRLNCIFNQCIGHVLIEAPLENSTASITCLSTRGVFILREQNHYDTVGIETVFRTCCWRFT